jgi:hypothetical protein
MIANTNFIHEIKKLTASAKETAIRTVNFQQTLLYWHIGERILMKNKKEKNEQIMEIT